MANCCTLLKCCFGLYFIVYSYFTFSDETMSSLDISDAVKTMVAGEKKKKKVNMKKFLFKKWMRA